LSSVKPFTERQAVTVQLLSSLKKQGIEEVEHIVQSWFDRAASVPEGVSDCPPETESAVNRV